MVIVMPLLLFIYLYISRFSRFSRFTGLVKHPCLRVTCGRSSGSSVHPPQVCEVK